MIKDYTLNYLVNLRDYFLYKRLYKKYKEYTMVPEREFIQNLSLIRQYLNVEGCIVECGVWRGGVSAGIADLLGDDRTYYLFDSFEGLPQAKAIDGKEALAWQSNTKSKEYYDNCSAEIDWAQRAMKMCQVNKYSITKGWFAETLSEFTDSQSIALLRLDGDWYDSTMDCLNNLYPKVKSGGLIILDDYCIWEGCVSAVHDYLSMNLLPIKIRQFNNGNVYYMIKP